MDRNTYIALVASLGVWAIASAAAPAPKNVAALEARDAEIEREWRPTGKDASAYFAHVLALLHDANASGFVLDEATFAIAKQALEKPVASIERADHAALYDQQVEIATWMLTTAHARSKDAQAYAEVRRELARAALDYLHTLQTRLRETVTDKRPTINVAPPLPTGGPAFAGMSPSAIKDPQARRAYEQAIEANAKLMDTVRQHVRLDLHVDRLKFLIRRMVEARYAQSPAMPDERAQWLAELDAAK